MQKIWPELQQMQKKVEHSLVEQQSCVGWKYGPCREKKLKIALLNETDFKVKFKCKLKIVFCKYLCTRFLGEIFDRIQLVPFFLDFTVQLKKENRNMFISATTNLSGIFGCG